MLRVWCKSGCGAATSYPGSDIRSTPTAIPAGPAASGLPVGVQLIGPLNGDAKTLALAQAIEENVRGFSPPPL